MDQIGKFPDMEDTQRRISGIALGKIELAGSRQFRKEIGIAHEYDGPSGEQKAARGMVESQPCRYRGDVAHYHAEHFGTERVSGCVTANLDAGQLLGEAIGEPGHARIEFAAGSEELPVLVPVQSDHLTIEASVGFEIAKLADQDGGKGATADLRTVEDVRLAYRTAVANSSNVMVEEHVTGSEYRLMVMNDRLFWAFERVPARVIGDGVSAVRELIEKVNLTRADNPSDLGVPQVIRIDEDLEEILRRRGQTVDSVPRQGELVRLRDTPLSATGGELLAVFDKVHPDNAELAVRAARLLRLDIAGVDFLSPDVGTSWRENGGQITEVNAGPQIGAVTKADMYTAFTRELVGGEGRIPVAVVIGGQTGDIEDELRAKTRTRASRLGIASSRGITIGAALVYDGPASPTQVARALTTDPGVDAIVWFTDGQSVATNGLPFDRIDLLVIAQAQVRNVNPGQLLSVIRENVSEVMLEGSQAQVIALAQTMDIKVSHANTSTQVVRKLLTILPKTPD